MRMGPRSVSGFARLFADTPVITATCIGKEMTVCGTISRQALLGLLRPETVDVNPFSAGLSIPEEVDTTFSNEDNLY
jgi:hypothetical protein